MPKKIIGVCKLCKIRKPLCRSHIVPDFAYEPLKNDKRQVYQLGTKLKKPQTGYYERLLCSCCESLISDFETTFKRDWMDTVPSSFSHLKTDSRKDLIVVSVPDFNHFKLFHLSVFWRAAVSSGFKMHPDTTLGPYEDMLAKMIRNKDSGAANEFPLLGILKLDENKAPVADIIQLARGEGRWDTHHYYMMTYAYCEWVLLVTTDGPKWLADLEQQCRDRGKMVLQVIPHMESKSFKLSIELLRAIGFNSSK